MRTYTVQEIMAVRDLYHEPPYPGFSLDEVLRKRALRGNALTRGENAWKVASAQSADEGVARIVQGALNKLAPEKYQEVIEQLTIPSLIASERAMQIVIDLIFKKALQEPGYSEMYAKLCYDMAMYELRLQQATVATTPSSSAVSGAGSTAGTPSSGDRERKASKFRDNIVRVAQKEFQLTDPKAFERLTGEELEEARSSLIKRKKANITFVGQLYLARVLSPTIMLSIVQIILQTGMDPAKVVEPPQEVDIEVLNALLETVGKSLDKDPYREKLDAHFQQLRQLLTVQYPMRIRFKIMNLLELRANAWEPRVTRADNQAPTTLQEQAKQASLRALGPRSPTVCTPNSRRGGGMSRFPSNPSFPDSPQPPGAAPVPQTWRNVAAPQRETPVIYTPADIANRNAASSSSKDVPFEKRVKQLMSEWVNERSNEPLPPNIWRQRLKSSEFDSEAELVQAIVAQVVEEACIVTKKDAQREACSFLRVGLALDPTDTPVSLGLVEVLRKAMEDGIKEDVPKFYERFVHILHMIMEKETILELYCDAAKLLYMTYDAVAALEGLDVMEELREVWLLLPTPGDDDSLLPECSIRCVVDLRDEGQDELAAVLVTSLVESRLVSRAAMDQWLSSTSAAQAQKVVQLVQEKLKGMVVA